MAFCGEKNRKYAACIKNAVNFPVAYIHKINFRVFFTFIHIC